MEYMIDDSGIAAFKNAFTKEYCENVIKLFEKAEANGFTYNRQVHEGWNTTLKSDESFTSIDWISNDAFDPGGKLFQETFWTDIYPIYTEKYGCLKDMAAHHIFHIKVQRTKPEQGYHVWHCEASNRELSNRIMAYTLYLNDVDEGGETEFLYQRKRIRATQGTLVLWPAAYTHTHRGNPPLSNTKYIMTGWVEF